MNPFESSPFKTTDSHRVLSIYLVVLYFVSILTIYIFLNNNYRPHDIDDVWSLSFIYNYLHYGSLGDICFGGYGNGIGFFGKIHAFLVGHLLNLLGYTKTSAHLLSILFLGIGLGIWGVFLGRLGIRRDLRVIFLLCAPLFEPFFTAATSTRTEAFEFMLCALSALLFTRRNYFLSMLVLWIGIESHPIGVVGFFYLAAAFIAQPADHPLLVQKPRQGWIGLVLGFALGFALFCFLHTQILGSFPAILAGKNSPDGTIALGPLFDYFFRTKYLRHLPEFLLFLLAIVIFGAKKIYRAEKGIRALLLATMAAALFIHRPNFHYTLFFYPALLLVTIKVADTLRLLKPLLILFLALLIPQYAFVYEQNRDFNFSREIQVMKESIPKDGLPVLGPPNAWFAFYDRPFFHQGYDTGLQDLGLGTFYLITDPHWPLEKEANRKWLEATCRSIQNLPASGSNFTFEKI